MDDLQNCPLSPVRLSDRDKPAPRRTVVLSVGGDLFETTKDTLCVHENSFFAKMFKGSWKEAEVESDREAPIFIDRDPSVFPIILQYLRSSKVYLEESFSNSFLERIETEAEYYALPEVASACTEELEGRQKRAEKRDSVMPNSNAKHEQFKCVRCDLLDIYLEDGWSFVSVFKGDEMMGCSGNGPGLVAASPVQHRCSHCGVAVLGRTEEHFKLFQPTFAVVKKYVCSSDKPKLATLHAPNTFRDSRQASQQVPSPPTFTPLSPLVLDASFG
jgi:hypothetical protein